MGIILRDLGRSTGVRHAVSDLASREPGREPETAALIASGYRYYIEHPAGLADMIEEAVSETLARGRLAPDAIGAVLLATESLWDAASWSGVAPNGSGYLRTRDAVMTGLLRSGLTTVEVYSNWLSGCGNVFTTLKLAASLVQSGAHDRVLVVLADRVRPGETRLMSEGRGIFSDVAVSFVVSHGARGYQLDKILTYNSVPLYLLWSPREMPQRRKEFLKSLNRLANSILLDTGRPISDRTCLISDNLSRDYLQLLSLKLRLQPNQLCAPSRQDFAHAFGADWLLSLESLSSAGQLSNGERVAVLNCGFASFNFGELQVLQA